MRILHTVEFYEPYKGGSEEVVKTLSEYLAAQGHEVAVATSQHPQRAAHNLNGVHIESFALSGNAVRGIRGDSQSYLDFVRSYAPDVILNYAAQTWPTDLLFPILDELECVKILVPLGYSKLHHRSYKLYFESLPVTLRKYDRLIYPSSRYQDKEFGDRHGLAEKAVIIPNGASRIEFETPQPSFRAAYGISSKLLLLCVANHYFAKGHRFIIRAMETAGVADCVLAIIGNTPASHGWYSCAPFCRLAGMFDKRIRVLESVPRELVVSAYLEADLFLFGSRVECAPLVMYESFASKTPFVSTPVGNVPDHAHLVQIVRTADEMAGVIRSYVSNPAPLRHLAEMAHGEFLATYQWDAIGPVYEQLYKTLLHERVAGDPPR